MEIKREKPGQHAGESPAGPGATSEKTNNQKG